MNLDLNRVEVWAADIDDKPGALGRTLAAIADAGVDLNCVIARRDHQRNGKGVVFVSAEGGRIMHNPDQIGLRHLGDVATLRIEGHNSAGIGAKIAETIAAAGINLHGFTGTVIGHRFVCYAGFDSAKDLEKAETELKKLTTHDWRFWRHNEAAEPVGQYR